MTDINVVSTAALWFPFQTQLWHKLVLRNHAAARSASIQRRVGAYWMMESACSTLYAQKCTGNRCCASEPGSNDVACTPIGMCMQHHLSLKMVFLNTRAQQVGGPGPRDALVSFLSSTPSTVLANVSFAAVGSTVHVMRTTPAHKPV